MQLEKTFTDSKTVSGIRYNPKDQIMTVTYVTGKSYNYFNVPESIFELALQAESIGTFLNHNIKGVYEYELIN